MNRTWSIIIVATIGSMLLRYFPFIIFSNNQKTPNFIKSLRNNLPLCAMGLLVVYCLRDISFTNNYGIPEIISVLFVIVSYYKSRNNLVSIFGGTLIYLVLVNLIF